MDVALGGRRCSTDTPTAPKGVLRTTTLSQGRLKNAAQGRAKRGQNRKGGQFASGRNGRAGDSHQGGTAGRAIRIRAKRQRLLGWGTDRTIVPSAKVWRTASQARTAPLVRWWNACTRWYSRGERCSRLCAAKKSAS